MSDLPTCIAIVPGCVDCARSSGRDHDGPCDDLCRLRAESVLTEPPFHAAYHRAQRCRACGAWCSGREAARLCDGGTCTLWSCPDCGVERGANVLLACKLCNPQPWWSNAALWGLRGLLRMYDLVRRNRWDVVFYVGCIAVGVFLGWLLLVTAGRPW